MREPKSNLEAKDTPRILNTDFSSKTDPFIFLSIALKLLQRSNQTKQRTKNFVKINKPLPTTASYRQIQVQKPTRAVVSNQNSNHTYSREQHHQHREQHYRYHLIRSTEENQHQQVHCSSEPPLAHNHKQTPQKNKVQLLPS